MDNFYSKITIICFAMSVVIAIFGVIVLYLLTKPLSLLSPLPVWVAFYCIGVSFLSLLPYMPPLNKVAFYIYDFVTKYKK